MPALWFVAGSELDAVAEWCAEVGGGAPGGGRGLVPVATAFLPDRDRLGGPGSVRSVGRAVQGAIVRATTEGDSSLAALAAGAPTRSSLALTCDGRAHRVRVCPEGPRRAWWAGAGAAVAPADVFVYGTLRAGEERHALMTRHRPLAGVPATVGGRLVDLGEYPGLVPAVELHETVVGELYSYADPAELLAGLDEVEDFFGYEEGDPPSLYVRSLAFARTARGERLAWLYSYVGPLEGAGLLVTGDWKRRG